MTGAGITALLVLLGGLVSLITWYAKRKKDPTPQEQIHDAGDDTAKMLAEIARLRASGDDAGADALLRRMREQATTPGQRSPGSNG